MDNSPMHAYRPGRAVYLPRDWSRVSALHQELALIRACTMAISISSIWGLFRLPKSNNAEMADAVISRDDGTGSCSKRVKTARRPFTGRWRPSDDRIDPVLPPMIFAQACAIPGAVP
jgi:hypothetical protein